MLEWPLYFVKVVSCTGNKSMAARLISSYGAFGGSWEELRTVFSQPVKQLSVGAVAMAIIDQFHYLGFKCRARQILHTQPEVAAK